MGYFERNIDRGRALEEKQRLNDAVLRDGWRTPSWEVANRRLGEQHYLRFSITDQDPDSGRREGVFSAAYRLLDEDEIIEHLREPLLDELSWFSENLPVPDMDVSAAIFMFRPDAGECADRIWNLVYLLRAHGLLAEMQTASSPGQIVYRDRYQIAVIPGREAKPL